MDLANKTLTRNDLSIYDHAAPNWWSGQTRWVRMLGKLVPARLAYFDRLIDWAGKEVLDLGCAGGFMAEALAKRGAAVTGIDPAEQAIAAARTHAADQGLNIRYDVGAGENLPYADALTQIDPTNQTVFHGGLSSQPVGKLSFASSHSVLAAVQSGSAEGAQFSNL